MHEKSEEERIYDKIIESCVRYDTETEFRKADPEIYKLALDNDMLTLIWGKIG